jgi:predicted nucleic acid binding AN1-type Zn finger protein
LADKEEEETFKELGNLQIHNSAFGYTCYVSAFAVFFSDSEIKISTSAVISAFNNIKSEEAFNALKLPIKNVIDMTEAGVVNKAYEIDLSSHKKLQKALNVNKLDCIPILWVYSSPKKLDWIV